MKRLRLWLALLFASICSLQTTYAQWLELGMTPEDFEVGKEYYLYNKEADAFFCGLGATGDGIYWGTRAGVSVTDAQPVIIQPALAEFATGGTSDNGTTVWMEEWDGQTYLFQVYNSKKDEPRWDELWFGVTKFDGIWTDRNDRVTDNISFFWNFSKNENGSYSISVSPKASGITSETLVQGGERLGVDLSTAAKIACLEGYNDGAELSYDWYFVSKEEYEKVKLSTEISAPEWSDYTIMYENDLTNPAKVSSGYFYTNSTKGCFKGTVITDLESTLSFVVSGYNQHDMSADTKLEVFVNGELKKTLTNYQLKEINGTDRNKVFIELPVGKNEISWVVTASGEDSKYCVVKNIGIEKTPTISVSLLEPGSLGTEILYNVDHVKDVRKLKIKGKMNADDWKVIDLMKWDIYQLDLSEAEFTEITDRQFWYYTNNGDAYSNLYSVVLPEGLIRIGERAFEGSKIENLEIPSTVQEIADNAFGYSNIESVKLPSNLSVWGKETFNCCNKLKTVVLPQTLESIPSGSFERCYSLEKCDLPENLKDIWESAFRYCYYLDVDVPRNVRTIGYHAFGENEKIDTLIFSNDFIGFAEGSFSGCTNLKYVELPVTFNTCNKETDGSFGGQYWIFHNCSNLNTVVLKSPTVVYPYYGSNKYNSFTAEYNISLIVPEHLVNSYKLDEYWYNFKEIIGFSTEEIDYWNIKNPLVLDARSRLLGNPTIKISETGSLKINGETGMDINDLYVDSHGTYEPFTSKLIVNNDGVKINGKLQLNYCMSGLKWYFISLPFDIKVSDISTGGKYAIRYYDGAGRALNGATGNWKNYGADDIIEAGTGFIYQTSQDGWTTFVSLDNESKQNIASNKMFVKALEANPSEKNSNKGWNLVGNPWQAYFNNHSVNFTAPITVWNGSTYVAYSLIDDDYAIKPNEAFFVQCPEEINSISFPITGRQMTSEITNQSGAKPRMFGANLENRQLIDLSVAKGDLMDKTRVVVNEGASADYETGVDASKFFSMDGAVPQVYTLVGEATECAINERPVAEGLVKVGFMAPEEGSYTFALVRNEAKTVVLIDHETGTTTDLTAGEYNFTAVQGTWNNRFELMITPAEPTAIEGVDGNKETKVAATGEGIVVEGTEGRVVVYSVDGKKVAEQPVDGTATISVAKGTYLVRTAKGTAKVTVR